MKSARLWLTGGIISLLLASCCKTVQTQDVKYVPENGCFVGKEAVPEKANYPVQPRRCEYLHALRHGTCPPADAVCPQRRTYLVTYDRCCDFPVTYKKN